MIDPSHSIGKGSPQLRDAEQILTHLDLGWDEIFSQVFVPISTGFKHVCRHVYFQGKRLADDNFYILMKNYLLSFLETNAVGMSNLSELGRSLQPTHLSFP